MVGMAGGFCGLLLHLPSTRRRAGKPARQLDARGLRLGADCATELAIRMVCRSRCVRTGLVASHWLGVGSVVCAVAVAEPRRPKLVALTYQQRGLFGRCCRRPGDVPDALEPGCQLHVAGRSLSVSLCAAVECARSCAGTRAVCADPVLAVLEVEGRTFWRDRGYTAGDGNPRIARLHLAECRVGLNTAPLGRCALQAR